MPQNGLPKGRFNKPVAKTAQRFSGSVSFDWRLYRYDIAGSIAHAAALARSGIITRDEQKQLRPACALSKKGMPFREAHEIVAKLVARSAAKSILLNDVPLAEIKKHSSLFAETPQVFDVHRSLAKRKAIGAPLPKNITAQIKRWRVRL